MNYSQSKDRGFNNEIEEDKDRHEDNASKRQGNIGKYKMATDFSDDERMNNNINRSNHNNEITSKKSL